MALLAPYRVIDLTDDRGHLAGLILAQLGADVVAIEPPGGSRARAVGPFEHDEPGPDGSFLHWSFNRGKRSVVLDLEGSAEDRRAFERLVAGADILVDDRGPGDARRLGPRRRPPRRAEPGARARVDHALR